jgi:hypothetical protein
MNRPRGHGLGAGGILRDHRLQHGEREPRLGVGLELPDVERKLAGAFPDGMRQRVAEVARGEIDAIGVADMRGKIARQLPFEALEVSLEGQPSLRSLNVPSGSPPPSTSRATSSPTAGPCLKPWPDPPPTSHAFAAAG